MTTHATKRTAVRPSASTDCLAPSPSAAALSCSTLMTSDCDTTPVTVQPLAARRSEPVVMLTTVVRPAVLTLCSRALVHTNRRWCTCASRMRNDSVTASSIELCASADSSHRSPAARERERGREIERESKRV
jgi:hypothetical protein